MLHTGANSRGRGKDSPVPKAQLEPDVKKFVRWPRKNLGKKIRITKMLRKKCYLPRKKI